MTARRWRVAIAGAGPAGLFLAEELLQSPHPIEIEFFEQMPEPFGLVRYGVAPDHPHTRRVALHLERILAHPRVRLHTCARVGRDLSLDELRARFDAVAIATGAADDRTLDIPGETLPNVWPSLHFAGWLNGHPKFSGLDIRLDVEEALIVGNGNVALDVARILCRTPAELAQFDLAPRARESMFRNCLRRIRVVGRRGPVQSSFGENELREFGDLAGIDFRIDPIVAMPSAADEAELAAPQSDRQRAVVAALREFASRPRPSEPRIELGFDFLRRPIAFSGSDAVKQATLEICRLDGEPFEQRAIPTGALQRVDAGLVIVSIGHRGRPIPGLPFDEVRGVIPTRNHRVVPGVYAVGWIKRGARGLIGHNRRDAMETARVILDDFENRNCTV
ncbi:MAG: FAD-dependent oxidoreductase [Kiritimatiellae bacterium]|nr:FAD-dependent oxidoreductase [Kiritimatiellia bacterium]MDW8458816.1 FAD-dependent oxidoreductase [Verrucomicrobiota bacterium]